MAEWTDHFDQLETYGSTRIYADADPAGLIGRGKDAHARDAHGERTDCSNRRDGPREPTRTAHGDAARHSREKVDAVDEQDLFFVLTGLDAHRVSCPGVGERLADSLV